MFVEMRAIEEGETMFVVRKVSATQSSITPMP